MGRMSCCGSLESGRSSQRSFIFSSSTNQCPGGPVSTEPQSHVVSGSLFSSVSALPLPFLSSVLAFSVQIRLWDSCPKPFIWTVCRVNISSCDPWWLEQAGSRQEGKSPVAPVGCWVQDSTSPESGWQGWEYTAGTSHPGHPSSCDTYPSCSFLLPPGLTKNVLSTVSPFPKTLWDRDHGVNVKMPPHSQASFVGKERGVRVQLDSVLCQEGEPLAHYNHA